MLKSHLNFEALLLGSILYDDRCLDDVIDIVKTSDFVDLKHKLIFDAILILMSEGSSIDAFLLESKLKTLKKDNEAGGLVYYLELRNQGFTPASAKHYAKKIAQASINRAVFEAANDILAEAQKENEALLDFAQHKILSISEGSSKEPRFAREVMSECMSDLIDLYENKLQISGLPTGFCEIDKITGGFNAGDLIILAARPGMGKTILALNIVDHIAVNCNKSVLFFSLEMTDKSLLKRVLSFRGNIRADRLKNGNLEMTDIDNASKVQAQIFDKNFILDDRRGLNVMDIRAKARQIKRKHGLDLLVVDYLGLIKRGKGENVNLQIGDITKALRNLAGELNCPVLLLSQLNRNVENRVNKRPALADLRDSGEIEQDADLVMFIYRDEVYEQESVEKGIAEIIIAKQRNGGTGTVKLGFEGDYYRFKNEVRQYVERPFKQDFKSRYSYKGGH